MELRPYQREALEATLRKMVTDRNVLIQAATGAGKTIFFSALIRHCMEQYNMRIAVVAHRETLVRQTVDKLLRVWPDGADKIGLACASVAKSVCLDAPVIVGSPQTLARRADAMPPVHLLIVDEAHRIPPVNVKSEYGTLIQALRDKYPDMRLVGVTATPYRLDHGYIYGDRCKKGAVNLFTGLTYEVATDTLQEQGYLVPLVGFGIAAPDLSGVRKSMGEYNLAELGNTMSQKLHVDSAVKAVREYAKDRQHIVVFAVTISHAETLAAAFATAGFAVTAVHSEQPHKERLQVLADFDAGRLQVIVNVGVLTEGWDCAKVDCMVMCRPTMSTALHIQMVGRGLRTHAGKGDCILLDLAGNWRRHGQDISRPHVKIPTEKDRKKVAPEPRICPACSMLLDKPVKTCPWCGHVFESTPREEENGRQEMARCYHTPPDKARVHVLRYSAAPYWSRKGNYMLKLSMSCQFDNIAIPVRVNQFLDLEGLASNYGQMKARQVWRELAGTDAPATVDEAYARVQELRWPECITVKRQDKYYNVVSWS